MTSEAYFGLKISNPPWASRRDTPYDLEGGDAICGDTGYRNHANATLEFQRGVIVRIVLRNCDAGDPQHYKGDKHPVNQLPSRHAISKSAYLIVVHTILLFVSVVKELAV